MSDKEVSVAITASSDSFKSSMGEASGAVESFASGASEHFESIKAAFEGVIAALGVEKIVEGIKGLEEEFGKLAEEIDRTSQITGLSAEDVQKFNFAVYMTGGSVDTAAQSLTRFEKNIASAATGTGATATAFKTMGVNVKDATGNVRPLNDILGDVADKFKNTADGVNKTAMALAIGGRGFAQMIPLLNQGREGLEELNAEMEKTGSKLTPAQTTAFKQLDDQMKVLNKSWEGFKLAVADFFEPSAKVVVGWITEIIQGATHATQALKEMFQAKSPLSAPGDSQGHGAPYRPKGESEAKTQMAAIPAQKQTSQADDIAAFNSEVDAYNKAIDQMEKADIAAADKKKILGESAVKSQEEQNQNALDEDKITNAQFLQQKLALQEKLNKIDLDAAEEKRDAVDGDVEKEAQADNEILKQKEKNADAIAKLNHEIVVSQQKDQQQLAATINSSFESTVESVVNGSKTMKQAFTEFANSVIGDIAKMAEKNVINSLFSGGTGASGTGGGLGGSIAGLFGGFLASGGPTDSSKGYVVGENGPEFFMPGNSGTVFNQDQMSKMGGTTIHMNVTTPDAQSFRQNQGQSMADMQAALRRSARNG